MKPIDYDRLAAVAYARRWAYRRNPAYYDFSALGGDCTNFCSQCLFAGAGVMNFTPVFGWFYRNANDRTASWTGVEFLYRFLTSNEGTGPFAEEVSLPALERGDLVQLGRADGSFYHTLLVSGFRFGIPLLATHTYDAFNRPLTSYRFEAVRFVHILGVRPNGAP